MAVNFQAVNLADLSPEDLELLRNVFGGGTQEETRQQSTNSRPTTGTSLEDSSLDNFTWQTELRNALVSGLRSIAADAGYSGITVESVVKNGFDQFLQVVSPFVGLPGSGVLAEGVGADGRQRQGPFPTAEQGLRSGVETATTGLDVRGPDMEQLYRFGLEYMANLLNIRVPQVQAGGGGGGGSRKPTAAELRAQFDLDELTDAARNLYRGLLVSEPGSKARTWAKAYVDAVVATGGEKALDFQTFIRTRIRNENRYKVLYANKPNGLSEEQFIAPYVAQASQVVGAAQGRGGLSDVVMQGAGLGASAQQFSDRLQRSDSVRQSAGFIGRLEQSVSSVSNLLKE